ncbi:hypothetical protein SELMODRAFT_426198 [Selaginella moellendorffii]|uniref:Morc S5 domain-containing protein n=1 Tax=Selaginella moellendorffii TaxID=88036 RepID=D8SVN3_SELML|nr:hypothetical protein SELMODRAFT_426198 [Selaginella moellendorffii]
MEEEDERNAGGAGASRMVASTTERRGAGGRGGPGDQLRRPKIELMPPDFLDFFPIRNEALEITTVPACKRFFIPMQQATNGLWAIMVDESPRIVCMSFGYSSKDKDDCMIGQYGNGFKTSTTRLGADVIVFSKSKAKRGKSFLCDTMQQDVIVPTIMKSMAGWRRTAYMAEKYPSAKHVFLYQYSLMIYASILYLHLPNNFKITLWNQEILHHNTLNDLTHIEEVVYKPKDGQYMSAIVHLWFLKDAIQHLNVQGFNVYHKNWLIKDNNCQKVGYLGPLATAASRKRKMMHEVQQPQNAERGDGLQGRPTSASSLSDDGLVGVERLVSGLPPGARINFWLDPSTLIACVVTSARGPPPKKPLTPPCPKVLMTEEKRDVQNRTELLLVSTSGDVDPLVLGEAAVYTFVIHLLMETTCWCRPCTGLILFRSPGAERTEYILGSMPLSVPFPTRIKPPNCRPSNNPFAMPQVKVVFDYDRRRETLKVRISSGSSQDPLTRSQLRELASELQQNASASWTLLGQKPTASGVILRYQKSTASRGILTYRGKSQRPARRRKSTRRILP